MIDVTRFAPASSLATPRGPLVFDGRPKVVGIVNVTPDSFSDGGRYLDPKRAVDHALRLEDEGAAIIDVGGVSTRPGSEAPSADVERARVLPVVEGLSGRLGALISVDTWRAEVFRDAFDRGASILNDVTGLRGDEGMIAVLAQTGAAVVIMHMQGEPATMQQAPWYDDAVREIAGFFERTLQRTDHAGIDRDRIALDPGIGFGKTLEHNLVVLRRISEFHELGRPLMLGTSRKGFLDRILDRSEPADRDAGTSGTTAHLYLEGVQLLRVHAVRAAADLIEILHRLRSRTTIGEDAL